MKVDGEEGISNQKKRGGQLGAFPLPRNLLDRSVLFNLKGPAAGSTSSMSRPSEVMRRMRFANDVGPSNTKS